MSFRIGVFPGTFDPITYGHIDIIKRARKIVDKLIIGVAVNSKKLPIFNLNERVDIIKSQISCFENNNIEIEIEIINGLLANFMQERGASLIIRGLRMASDFAYEFQMSCINKRLNEDIETIFLTTAEENQFISSSFVKEVALLGGDVSKFLPANIARLLKERINIIK